MNWIMEPLSGYDALSTIFSDTCTGGALYSCPCVGCLNVCSGTATLKAPDPGTKTE